MNPAPAQRLVSLAWLWGLLPFALLLAAYVAASQHRLADNPQDKLLPSLAQMGQAVQLAALEPDRRTGEFVLFADTLASLKRLALGVGSAALFGLLVGLNMGLHAAVKRLFGPFLTAVSLIPPLAILPILFIALGVEEFSKVALIFLGVFPVVARDVLLATEQLPRESLVKAVTLGASGFAVTYRIVMPQILPRLIDAVRLALGGAWLFLIAAEAIASTEGLGYRIFLVRRYLAMDMILPYVAWVTLLGYSIDLSLRQWLRRRYPWYARERA